MTDASISDPQAIPIKPKRQPYEDKLELVPQDVVELLELRYGLTFKEISRQGFKWAPKYKEGRLAMPINNRFGGRVGYVFRSLTGQLPKTINMIETAELPAMSWYPMDGWPRQGMFNIGSKLVVVEDQLSALKVARQAHCVALLGTIMSDSKMMDIVKAKPKSIVIALDADATAKAYKMQAQFSGLIDDITVAVLRKDLKEEPDEAIETILKL